MPPKRATIKGRFANKPVKKPTKSKDIKEIETLKAKDVWDEMFGSNLDEAWYKLTYTNGSLVLDPDRIDVMYEVRSFIESQGDMKARKTVSTFSSPEDLLWNQSFLEPFKKALEKENQTFSDSRSRVGPGLCARCGCTSILYEYKQLRGKDEGETELCQCTSCNKKWAS